MGYHYWRIPPTTLNTMKSAVILLLLATGSQAQDSFFSGLADGLSQGLQQRRQQQQQQALLQQQYEQQAALLQQQHEQEQEAQRKQRAFEAALQAEEDERNRKLVERQQVLDNFKAGLISRKEARASLRNLGYDVGPDEQEPPRPRLTPQQRAAALEKILLDNRCTIENVAKEFNQVRLEGRRLQWSDIGPVARKRMNEEAFYGLSSQDKAKLIRRYFAN